MPLFKVRFTRTEFKSCEKQVEAATREEAEAWADGQEVADAEWKVANAEEDCFITYAGEP